VIMMKSFVPAILLLILLPMFAIGADYEFTQTNEPAWIQQISHTYDLEQVDTLYWVSEPGVYSASLEISTSDTAIAVVTLQRMGLYYAEALAEGDTIVSINRDAAGVSIVNITLAPIPAKYMFIITYSDAGAPLAGATVGYRLRKHYYLTSFK